jgi:hypothetical protein
MAVIDLPRVASFGRLSTSNPERLALFRQPDNQQAAASDALTYIWDSTVGSVLPEDCNDALTRASAVFDSARIVKLEPLGVELFTAHKSLPESPLQWESGSIIHIHNSVVFSTSLLRAENLDEFNIEPGIYAETHAHESTHPDRLGTRPVDTYLFDKIITPVVLLQSAMQLSNSSARLAQ